MHSWPTILSMVCASGAAVGCVYLAVAILAVTKFPRRQAPNSAPAAPVSVLKPLHGDEPGLAARLSGYFDQNYGGVVHMVCGVREDGDGAAEHARHVRRGNQGSVDLIVSAREHGPNRKISNLVNILSLARHDILVISDSDIEVGRDYLARVVAELHEENVGAVTCLYHGVSSRNIWSRHESLVINSHFLPNMVVAVTFGLANPCCGSTIVVRRRTLEAIGGFERFGKHLADDYEIGKSVRQAGYKVAIPGFTVGHHCFSDSFRSLLARELRAARTVRSIDPLGYAGAFITHPFPLALAGAFAYGSSALALAACALSLRALLCMVVEKAFALPRQPYTLLLANEMISFLAFGGASLSPE
ncbi:bacteriohopanetetrol glucosamine biosynthesis glycosyltransferase HpnI [Methylocystis sp. IM2]|uniref:bacteriohopanetetrol glucosamine biosynthesis glycosyltransferase HpnI n=1 Tax=Methylocystis sp. IM2 TaxID=3136563 RepID=UPI0030F64BBF